jgi:hypothetical protein
MFRKIKMATVNPADTSRLISSVMPRRIAAVNPIIDHIKGIMKIPVGIFLLQRSNNPKVNMVVGQGSPKLGA